MREAHYFYFNLSIQHLSKCKPFLFIVFFIEYYDTFIHLCEASIYLRNTDAEIEQLIAIKNKVNIISPLNYLRETIKTTGNQNWSFAIFAFALLCYVFNRVFITVRTPFKWRSMNVLIVNMIDLFICRVFALCVIDLLVYWVFFYLSAGKTLIWLIFCLLTIAACVIYFCHIRLYYVFSTGQVDYPFNKVTMMYDTFLLVLKILLCLNKNAIEVIRKNDQIVFFFNIVVLVFALSGFCFLGFIYYSYPCNFINNQLLHREKAFFVILFTQYFIAFLLLNEHEVLMNVLMVGLALFSLVIVYAMDPIQRCFSSIGYCQLENQLMFIMNLSLMPPYFELKYDEEVKRHFIYCKQCHLCKMLLATGALTEKKTLTDYNLLFFDLMTQSILKRHNKGNKSLYDLFDILTRLRGEDCFNYKLQLRFKQLIEKHAKDNYFISMNLRYLHSVYCREMKICDLSQFKLIALFDAIVSQTKEVIAYIQRLFLHSVTTPQEVIELSELLETIDAKQQKILNSRENMQNYTMVLLRIANEELLNSPLKKEDGMMRVEKNFSEDFLTFHFVENRIMVISVDLAKKSYAITRTGNELIKYLSLDFAQMFPKEYRLTSMTAFNAIIYSHKQNRKELFEAVIQLDFEGANYALFRFTFYLSPGLHDSNFSIIGEYFVSPSDILITSQSESNANVFETIYWVNNRISPMLLGGNPARNKDKRIFRKSLLFSDLFVRNSSLNVFIFKKNETEWRLTFCFEFKQGDACYKVYLVKSKDLSKKTHKGADTNSQTASEVSIDKDNHRHTIDDNKSIFWLDDSSSVNTTSTKSCVSARMLKGRGGMHKYVKQTQSKLYLSRFKKTSNLILSFCLLLICYMFGTLFVELDLNNSIIRLYNIYTNFRAANRLYFTMISNIIGVICVGKTNSNNCVNYYELFTQDLTETTPIRLNIFNYIILENKEKMTEFAQRIKLLKLNIHQLNDDYCSSAYNQDFNYSLLSSVNDELYLINQTTTFSNALEILVNSLMTIIFDPHSTKMPIYAYSTDPYDFSHIYNRQSLSKTQFEYYNSFINYRSYLLTWNSIQKQLYVKIIERLDNFNRLSNTFMVVTYLFHLLLCGLLFFYLKSFLTLLVFQIDRTIAKMHLIENKRFYLMKLGLVLELCKLYEKSPIAILKSIDELYHEYFKQQKMQKAFETKEEVSVKKEEQLFKTPVYFEVILKYFYFVLAVFVYYTALFLVFILLRNLKIKETVLVVDLIEETSYGDSAGFNGLTLIQLMFMANLTESSISEALHYEGDDYFVNTFTSAVDIYYSYIKKQRATELVCLASDYISMSCDRFYYEIDDLIINSIEEKYPHMRVKEELSVVCRSLNFLVSNDSMVIIKTLFYNLLQIGKTMKRASFDVYLEVINNSKLFEIFSTVFLFFQPLRTWANTKVFDTAIEKITNEETVILIIYLVLNNLTELVLLALLYFYLIKHITKMNRNINRVISVFKIKHEKNY